MSPERWQQITAIFHAAREQPEAEVEAFLRRECGDDAPLYSQVRAMLDQHARTGLLDHSPVTRTGGSPVFTAGATISGRYRIVRFLGRGGMGEVYEADDLELKERVALKTLLPEIASEARMIARFMQEIQLSRKIAHPNVCRVFDLARRQLDDSSSQGTVFLTMEFLPGETLAARLQREGRLTTEAALPLLGQMTEALDAAHRAGVIHRDLKPSNVMLVPGPNTRAVVTDFGLARKLATSGETTATLSGQLIGTLDYMAPELLTGGAASVQSDVYALGTVAYKMVTGELPFASEHQLAGVILRSKNSVPAPRSVVPEIDPAFDRAIIRALDPDPARRFSTAPEFARALRGDAPSVTVTLPVMTRRRVATAVFTLALLATGAFGWRAWVHSRNQPSAEALSFYHKGVDDIHAGAYFAATKALAEAVHRAPHFTLARVRMAEAWFGLDVPERASQEMLLARREDNSDLSELDHLQIEAVDLTVTREFVSAVGKYEQMLRIAGTAATDLTLDLGRAYERAGQPTKAIESFRRAADGSAQNPAAWLRLAVLYARASEYAKSTEAFRRSESLYQLTSNLEGITEVAYERGIEANRVRQLDEAAQFLSKALETARLAGNVHQEIRAQLQLANNAFLAGDTARAEADAREALDTARANDMEPLAISGIVNLGNAYVRKQDYAGAERDYRDALAMARRNVAPRLTALSLLSLAALHDHLKRSTETDREAREALAYYQANGFAQESFQCLTMIGRIQRDRGDFTGALASFEDLLRIAEKSQDRFQTALAHESIGSVLVAEEQYPQALEHYQKDLELSTDPEQLGYARLECANTLRVLGRWEEARAMLDQVESVAERVIPIRLYLLLARSELSLLQHEYANASSYARRGLALNLGQNQLIEGDLKRILGLSSVLASHRRGIQDCEEALSGMIKLNDSAAIWRARVTLLQARLATRDREGALQTFHELEPDLGGHPESRWRALAMISQFEDLYRIPARQALEDLASRWGDATYRVYVSRPDLGELSRPLLPSVSAKKEG